MPTPYSSDTTTVSKQLAFNCPIRLKCKPLQLPRTTGQLFHVFLEGLRRELEPFDHGQVRE